MVELKKIELDKAGSKELDKADNKQAKDKSRVQTSVIKETEQIPISEYNKGLKKLKLNKDIEAGYEQEVKQRHMPDKTLNEKDKFMQGTASIEEPDKMLNEKDRFMRGTTSVEELQQKMIEDNLVFQIEKKKLELISKDIENNTLQTRPLLIEPLETTVDELLLALNKQTTTIDDEKPFLEMITFLDNKPRMGKIHLQNLHISNLYSKIEDIEKKIAPRIIQTEYLNQNDINQINQKPKRERVDIVPLIERIEIPEIITIEDDTKITDALKNEFIDIEKKAEPEKPIEPSFVISGKKVVINPVIEDKIKKIKQKKAEQLPKQVPEVKVMKDTRESQPFDYLLPKDYFSQSEAKGPNKTNSDKGKQNLIYTSQIKPKIADYSQVNEKYNINEFTFVDLSYMEGALIYNIIQPELTKTQEEIYQGIKRAFLDSIDVNYYSFKGDKQEINNYIQKVFDLTLNKLSFDLTSLEKKLYFNLIKQEFSGLGFLSPVLEDNNILEVNCIGAGLPIMVYHIKYGLVKTNLLFDKISKLNLFVLSLTKVMGIHVSTNNPMINGYMPNGYKVEGLYSVGDLSSKGSSFIIKKYLERPLTPNYLINMGIGTIDVFSYIWAMMEKDNRIVLTGGDAILMINSLAQFYPNKSIVSIQSHDYLNFPQKNWVKKLVQEGTGINKNVVLSQAMAERPEYIVLDEFNRDMYSYKWYDINMTFVDFSLLPEYIDKVKAVGINVVVIYLERQKISNIEQMQISKIVEIHSGKIQKVVEFIKEDNVFHINLLQSDIDIVGFYDRQKILRWIQDTDISDYLDFNNIINDYTLDKDRLFKKLAIEDSE